MPRRPRTGRPETAHARWSRRTAARTARASRFPLVRDRYQRRHPPRCARRDRTGGRRGETPAPPAPGPISSTRPEPSANALRTTARAPERCVARVQDAPAVLAATTGDSAFAVVREAAARVAFEIVEPDVPLPVGDLRSGDSIAVRRNRGKAAEAGLVDAAQDLSVPVGPGQVDWTAAARRKDDQGPVRAPRSGPECPGTRETARPSPRPSSTRKAAPTRLHWWGCARKGYGRSASKPDYPGTAPSTSNIRRAFPPDQIPSVSAPAPSAARWMT